MTKAAAGGGGDGAVADQLRALGVKGVLVQMAERGQLLALKCEMPQCYHHKGRGAFDPVTTPRTKWAPSPDHYPILKSAGGQLVLVGQRAPVVAEDERDVGVLRRGRGAARHGLRVDIERRVPRPDPQRRDQPRAIDLHARHARPTVTSAPTRNPELAGKSAVTSYPGDASWRG